MEEATFLTKFASQVFVVHRRDKLRASKVMQERAQHNPKITFLLNTTVDEVRFHSLFLSLSLCVCCVVLCCAVLCCMAACVMFVLWTSFVSVACS